MPTLTELFYAALLEGAPQGVVDTARYLEERLDNMPNAEFLERVSAALEARLTQP